MVLEYAGSTVYPVGELKHVTGWKEFSGIVEEQDGHYFVAVFGPAFAGKLITCQNKDGKTFQATDRVWVLRVADKTAIFTFTVDGAVQAVLDFSKITLKED